MHHHTIDYDHTQITVVVILLPVHSYIVGGEDAIWQVLDGKVALGRHVARSTTNVLPVCIEQLSDDHYQTFDRQGPGPNKLLSRF